MLAAGASAQAAPTMALLPTTGLGVPEDMARASRTVLEGHLVRSGKVNVVIVGEHGPELTGADVVQKGRDAKADVAGILRLTGLGNVVRVRFEVYQTASGNRVYWDDLPTSSPSDLDAVLQRLANAYVEGKTAAQMREMETSTMAETSGINTRSARMFASGRLAGAAMLNTPSGMDSTFAGFGAAAYYDAVSFLADAGADILFGSGGNSTVFNLSVGGYYPLWPKNFSPYVGGALRYSVVGVSTVTKDSYGHSETATSSAGLSPQLTAGVVVGRFSSNIQLRAEISYFANVFRIQGKDSDKSIAQGLSLSAGICFR
jgi:hypothetical protein